MESTLSFQAFLTQFRKAWKPGQHLSIIGATGAGKTYLAQEVLEPRKYTCLVSTKLEDKTLKRYKGYKKIEQWSDRHIAHSRYLLWPKPKSLRDPGNVREAIYDMMESVFKTGGWTICFDDILLVARELHLRGELATMMVFVRSHGTSIVGLYQRPVWVPREVVTQSSHWLIFGPFDEEDLKVLAHSSAIPYKKLLELNRRLSGYNFLWLARGREPVFVERSAA